MEPSDNRLEAIARKRAPRLFHDIENASVGAAGNYGEPVVFQDRKRKLVLESIDLLDGSGNAPESRRQVGLVHKFSPRLYEYPRYNLLDTIYNNG